MVRRSFCFSVEYQSAAQAKREVRSVNQSFAITSEVDRRNSSVCRFTVECTLQIGSLTFEDKEAARVSFPLAQL